MNTIERPNKQFKFKQRPLGHFWVGEVALGNMTQYNIWTYKSSHGEIFVAIQGRGAYRFFGFVYAGYSQAKLGLSYESDAAAVADFINDQMGWSHNHRQGQYDYPGLLEGGQDETT